MTPFILAALVSIQVQSGYLEVGQPSTVAVSCQDCSPFDTIARLYIDAPTTAYVGTWQPGDFFAATPTVMVGSGWGNASLGLGLHVKFPIRSDWPRAGTILTFQLQPIDASPVTVALVQDMEVVDDAAGMPAFGSVPHDPTEHVILQFDNTNVVSILAWPPDACHTQPQMIELLACWHSTPQGVVSQSTCAFIANTAALHFDLPDVTLGLGQILYWRTTASDGFGFFCGGD